MVFDPVLQKHDIDPNSALGIAIKAYPQASINVLAVYPLERTKNELQFGNLPEKSSALDAARAIYRTQGWQGFYRGALVKIPGAGVQHAAALTLLAWGKRRLAQQQKQEQAPEQKPAPKPGNSR